MLQAIAEAEEEGARKKVEAESTRKQIAKLQKEEAKTLKEKEKTEADIEALSASLTVSYSPKLQVSCPYTSPDPIPICICSSNTVPVIQTPHCYLHTMETFECQIRCSAEGNQQIEFVSLCICCKTSLQSEDKSEHFNGKEHPSRLVFTRNNKHD